MSKTGEVVILGGTRHVVIQCGTCGVLHSLPEVRYDSAYREGGFWTCPNGHSRGWKDGADKSELDNVRRERDRLKQQQARLEEEASEARQRADKAEKANRRLKKRAAAGTCPCCQRTFANMSEHMKHQHPEYVEQTGAKVVPIKRSANVV